MTSERHIHPKTRIGRFRLKVADTGRSLGFYRGIPGFEMTRWYAEEAAFLFAGGYHHRTGLNTWAGRGASPTLRGSAGLFHLAVLYTARHELAKALGALLDKSYPVDGAPNHGVSEALYLRAPNQNGVELTQDRPKEDWPHTEEGEDLAMVTRPLDVRELLAELDEA